MSDDEDGNQARWDDSDNDNTIHDDAFTEAQGVMSVVQNNGPNSAINNGNTVSAITVDNANNTDETDANTEESQDHGNPAVEPTDLAGRLDRIEKQLNSLEELLRRMEESLGDR